MAEFLFLGTGASLGVPIIGCSCPVCTSSSVYNKRLRPSALIRIGSKQFVIDTGPDFRNQALKYHINEITGVLFTHAHHDHTAGLDDLRPLFYKHQIPLPLLLSKETADDIHNRFHYIFKHPKNHPSFFAPQLLPGEGEGEVVFEGLSLQFVTYEQAKMKVNGFRVGELAYLSDIREYSESIFERLVGVNILIISALRHTPSKLHFSVEEAINFAKKINAKNVWLTHLSHELDYEKTNACLPSFVQLAYDGLTLEFNESEVL